jgi:NAD(P)H-nitrite reductase large subunit
MHMSRKVVDIQGYGKNAHTVVLDDGTKIPADLLLLGAGVFPSTKFLQGSGIDMDNWGGIICDPFL